MDERWDDLSTPDLSSRHDEAPWEELRAEDHREADGVRERPLDTPEPNDASELGVPIGSDSAGRRDRRRSRTCCGRRGRTAIDMALNWLARHQSPDGRWDADGFMNHGDPALGPLCDGPGDALHDVGLTGLALLNFLGAGETHRSGEYRDTVRRAQTWLLGQQDAEGCFGSRSTAQFTYDHAIAALALCEAYGLTKSPLLKDGATRGVRFCLASQNPGAAWRYGVADGESDTSVTGWMLMVFVSAEMAGIPVGEAPKRWALDWLEEMTDPGTGRTGYRERGGRPSRAESRRAAFPVAESEAPTAVALLSRVLGGQDPAKHRTLRSGAELLRAKLPRWNESEGSIDMYYWYYGTLAMYQVGGKHWDAWHRALEDAVVETQRGSRDEGEPDNFTGSWDPKGAWGENGGRVYSTAIMTLSLEVYYLYGKVFGAK
ncbi:MAG: prenyltransferase/squalene oxidase repeat-containing protein [Planctomycetota bacterium]